jgi:hypothetical protein
MNILGFNFLYNNKLFVRLNHFNYKDMNTIFFSVFLRKTLMQEVFYFFHFNRFCLRKLFFLSVNSFYILYKFCLNISFLFFYFRFFIFRVFKAHGINMRLLKRTNYNYFLRAGYSHGVLFFRSSTFFLKVFRKRYFIVYGFDSRIFENFTFHLRFLRRFFKYKLIGIKAQRDVFKIKVGKKKSF